MEKPIVAIGEIINLIASSIAGDYLHKIPYQPIYMEGTTGIGKTQMVENELPGLIAQKTKTNESEWSVITMKLSYYTSSDILGMPIVRNVKSYPTVEYIKENILPRKEDNKKGILFLDEIPLVSNGDVRSALYDLLQNNKLGNDYYLPDNWYVVAAGNRRQDSGIYNGLSPALRDRVMMFEAAFDKDSYIQYLEKVKANKAVVNYLKTITNREIHSFDTEKELNLCPTNEIFSTPRSFEDASNKIALYETNLITIEQLEKSLQSVVGQHTKGIMRLLNKDNGFINEVANWSPNDPDNPKIDILEDHYTDHRNSLIEELKKGTLPMQNRLNISGFLIHQGIPETMINEIKSYFGADGMTFNAYRAEVQRELENRSRMKTLDFNIDNQIV